VSPAPNAKASRRPQVRLLQRGSVSALHEAAARERAANQRWHHGVFRRPPQETAGDFLYLTI